MSNLFFKVAKNPATVIPVDNKTLEKQEVFAVGEKIHDKVKHLFSGSLAIREVDAGSDNAVEQELVALSNAFYDVERFGIHFVASPRHADMLMVTGPITRNMAEAVKKAYNATPNPKIIVAVGDDAINGGIYKGSYAIFDNPSDVIPIHFQIPGDPPSPKEILYHLLKILETVETQSPR